MGPTLDALEASFRDFGILGQRPLAPAADVVATLSTNISGLDQRLAAVSASLTADHDALAANQASLAALGHAPWMPSPCDSRAATSSRRSRTSGRS